MQGEEQPVIRRRQPQEGGAQQGAAGEIEGPAGLLGGQAASLGIARRRGKPAEIHLGQDPGCGDRGRRDLLRRLAVALGKDGAQRFVAADGLAQGGCEPRRVQAASQPQGERHVVG